MRNILRTVLIGLVLTISCLLYTSANAYGMYLVHYVFAIWLQYALLVTGLLAIGKAAIVFGGTLLVSCLLYTS